MITESNPSNRVDTGEWGKTMWEFWRSSEHPPAELCSAIGLVAITNLDTNSVVLTHNDRGWEMIAGGIDPGEGPEEALKREAIEEGGFVVVRQQLYGYRKIINTALDEVPVGKSYPPLAYMPYYYAETDEPLRAPTGDEIIERDVFSIDDRRTQELLKPGELLLIQEGLRAARQARGSGNS